MGLVVLVAGYAALLQVAPGGSVTTGRIGDVITAACAAAATWGCLRASRRDAVAMWPFWRVLALGCAAWTTGELVWGWYEVVLRVEAPFPSPADLAYLAGPVLAVVAFALHPALRQGSAARVVAILDGLAVASAVLLVSWSLVLGQLWQGTGGFSLGSLVGVAYPFSDVILLVLVVLAGRAVQPGNRLSPALLLGGLVCMALSDSAYTYLMQTDQYQSGNLIGVGWVACYLSIAAAALITRTPGSLLETRQSSSDLSSYAPYLPVLIALIAIPAQLHGGNRFTRPEVAIAACLIAVVLARQVLDLLSRRRGPVRPAGPPSIPAQRTAYLSEAESALLSLHLASLAKPTPREQVQRLSARVVTTLTSVAGALAVWDLSLLVRGS